MQQRSIDDPFAALKRLGIKMIRKASMIASDNKAYFLAGMVCAAVTLPFGLIPAALTPVFIGFVKALYDHYAGGTADLTNFAWLLAGDAAFLAGVRMIQGATYLNGM
jgi:hypothetical protein